MMPEKIFASTIPEWMHIWLALLTALWGGAVSYLRRLQFGESYSFLSASMHLITSGFAGLICWLGCVQFEMSGPMTAICTGLSGHMGAEFIRIVECKFCERLRETISTATRKITDSDQSPNDTSGNLSRRGGSDK